MAASMPAALFLPAAAAFAAGAFSSGLLLWAAMPLLRRRLLDQPTGRSSHQRPTPRGGGVAFVLVAVVAAGLEALLRGVSAAVALPLLVLPLGLVGLLDDRWGLPTAWRYAVQLLTATVLVGLSPLEPPWPALPLLWITVTAVINFTNFMDGLDGLVAGCLAVALAAAAVTAEGPWSLWALVGALGGFLLWNWSPARVFMGDVGSTFLGALFAGVVLQSSRWPDALGLLLVLAPLLLDAGTCVPRRLQAGQPVLIAHRLHLYQRLHQAGWSHARVSALYIAATATLALAWGLGGVRAELIAVAGAVLWGWWLDQRVAVPFAVAARL